MKGQAWAPAHITSFFLVPKPQNWDLPLTCGSTGAGICLDQGVTCKVSLSDDPYINISHNDKLAQDPVSEAVLKAFVPPNWGGDVELELELPLGGGLGISGACALATATAALCALGEWDVPPKPGESFPAKAIGNAHIAEVLNRSGMGDVAAQAACFATGQPLDIRRHPGVDDLQHNVDTYPAAPATKVVLGLTGQKVDTRAQLENEERMDFVRRAGARAKRNLPESPTLFDVTRLGRRFAEDAGLVPEKLEPALDIGAALENTEASISMLGTTLYGVGDVKGLQEAWAGYGEVVVCEVLSLRNKTSKNSVDS